MPTSENPQGEFSAPVRASDSAASVTELRNEVRSLRNLFNLALLALVVLVAGLFVFMLRETKVVRRQVEENTRLMANYKRDLEPRIHELQSRLVAYAKDHPAFTPILVKYFGSTNALPPTSPMGLPGSVAPTAAPPPQR